MSDIGGDTSGRDTDLGGSRSGGDAGDKPHQAFGDETRDSGSAGGVTRDEAEQKDDLPEGTPDDVAFGSRRAAGRDEDSGGG